ncbi:MAG: hypothetical protein F6K40_26930 [Okeania sp. SIO3I5]|uniref:hypothetical protein n=1 Tax=Okeania sp. SIO3I5 TaxID=2607805 RepID=UPI0013B63C93|nr:hypothetical protein [Okeania sp. SIO3I5]NEQ39689.1 hypothetical protein [Okeania sp. SIO3I5]
MYLTPDRIRCSFHYSLFIKLCHLVITKLVAVQKINNDLKQTIFGIVSNGELWQFGKLKEDVFTRNIISYNIESLDKLFAVVNYVFQQCLLQLENSEENL